MTYIPDKNQPKSWKNTSKETRQKSSSTTVVGGLLSAIGCLFFLVLGGMLYTPYPYQRFQHIMVTVYHLFVWDFLRTREFKGIDILLGWYFGARLVVLSYSLGDGPLLGMASLH